MNPRITEAKPIDNFYLEITFDNGEVKIFDVNPYLDKGIFRQLKNKKIFNAVKVSLGTVSWPGNQDFCPDTIYENSTTIN